MTVRHLTLALVLGATVVVPAGVAAAAPTACPPAFRLVTPEDLRAELVANGAPQDAVDGVEQGVFGLDRNRNGKVCQQLGSYGRAQGLPDFYSNFRDDRTVR